MRDTNIFLLLIAWQCLKRFDHVECEYFVDLIYEINNIFLKFMFFLLSNLLRCCDFLKWGVLRYSFYQFCAQPIKICDQV